jgi:tRNA threonylcarbamoyladenosine biosynthesis protein TsaE
MEFDAGEKVFNGVALWDIEAVAEELVQFARDKNIWLFHGEMGAGKTTLIKAIGKVFGIAESMSSPTFALVNEYLTQENKKVFHFDFYRIKNETEAYDIGIEEYFDSGSYCLVEWPEKIQGLLPEEHADIKITLSNNTHRTIAISIHGGKGKKENRV